MFLHDRGEIHASRQALEAETRRRWSLTMTIGGDLIVSTYSQEFQKVHLRLTRAN